MLCNRNFMLCLIYIFKEKRVYTSDDWIQLNESNLNDDHKFSICFLCNLNCLKKQFGSGM